MRVLVMDPGDSTGWLIGEIPPGEKRANKIWGGTIYKNLVAIEKLFTHYKPDIVVFESFQLYAGAARHMVHNDFYVIQVIGAIKMLASQYGIQDLVPQAPSVKKYSGGLDDRWGSIIKEGPITEHTKDTFMHLRFFERFGLNK